MTFRRAVTGTAAVSAALLLVACGGEPEGGGGGEDGVTEVSLYYSVPIAEQSLAQIALDNDLFPDSVDVDVQGGDSTVGLTLVSSGRAQFYLNAAPVPEQIASGGAPVVWAGYYQDGIDTQFIARPGIDSVEDLVGKRVGIIQPGQTISVLTNIALREGGVDPEEVTQVPLGNLPSVNGAFAAGTVDAIATVGPAARGLLAEVPGATLLRNFADDFQWNGAGIAINSDWAEDNRDAAIAVLTGLNAALELLHEDPAKAEASIATVTGLSGEALTGATRGVAGLLSDQIKPMTEEVEASTLEALREDGSEWATEEFGKKMVGDPTLVEEAVGDQ